MARSSERVSFLGGTGFQLAGIVDLPDGHPKATVLFTHCFTCSKDLKAIVRISRGLAEHGYLVLRYDLTGLGGSEGDFSQTNFTTNRADLRAASSFLTENFAPPSFLIGHSFGGACSLSMANEIASVRGIVSLASPSDTTHLADLLQRMDPKIVSAGVGEVTIGGRSYAIARQMLADFRAFDLPALLQKLAKPTLLFHSPEDETLNFDHALRLYGLLTQRAAKGDAEDDTPPAPVSLICLPAADHLLVNNPADISFVTHTITAWFTRLLAN
ncbi:MAG: alpha/beta fold hydrolase [Pirellulaceae bacterium]|nr:alpha/beta fold hydrolase [Pirellulaceae bacterium]